MISFPIPKPLLILLRTSNALAEKEHPFEPHSQNPGTVTNFSRIGFGEILPYQWSKNFEGVASISACQCVSIMIWHVKSLVSLVFAGK